MSEDNGARDRDELARALKSLQESGIEFRGPIPTSKGEVMLVGDKILTVAEFLDLFARGQLNGDGIRGFQSEKN